LYAERVKTVAIPAKNINSGLGKSNGLEIEQTKSYI
jgi:hypothetical protein